MAGARARKLDLSGLIQLGGQANAFTAAAGRAKGAKWAALGGGLERGATRAANIEMERRGRAQQQRQFDARMAQDQEQFLASLGLRKEALSLRRQETDTRNKWALLEIIGRERAGLRSEALKLSMLKQQDPEAFMELPALQRRLASVQKDLRESDQRFASIVQAIPGLPAFMRGSSGTRSGTEKPRQPRKDLGKPGAFEPPSELAATAGAARTAIRAQPSGGDIEQEYLATAAEFEQARKRHAAAERAQDTQAMIFWERVMRKTQARMPVLRQRLQKRQLSILGNAIFKAAEQMGRAQIDRALTDEEREEVKTYVQAQLQMRLQAKGQLGQSSLDMNGDVKQITDSAVSYIQYLTNAKTLGKEEEEEEQYSPEEALADLRLNNPVTWQVEGAASAQGWRRHAEVPAVPPGVEASHPDLAVEYDEETGEPAPGKFIQYLIDLEETKPGRLALVLQAKNISPIVAQAVRKAQGVINQMPERAEMLQAYADIKAAYEAGQIDASALRSRLEAIGITSLRQAQALLPHLPPPSREFERARVEYEREGGAEPESRDVKEPMWWLREEERRKQPRHPPGVAPTPRRGGPF